MHYTLTALLTLGLITLISQLFESQLELVNIALIHLIPIIVVALRGNFTATSVIAIVSILLFNILYVPPIYSFSIHDAIYFWSFAIFLLVGYIERHVTVDISPNLELFWGDENLLNRLFANLLDNAFKYSNQNKQIVIRIVQEAKRVKITFFNESKPFQEKAIKSIFDSFYRLENAGDISGSGIGLFICHSIVSSHGGKISAYNQYNGVCFEIILPIVKHPKQLQNEL